MKTKRHSSGRGVGLAGFLLFAGAVVFVLALNVAFIAGTVVGFSKAWVAFSEGREGAMLAWMVLCAFCFASFLQIEEELRV